MAVILLFNYPDLLDAEWLASAVSIAITYVVFMLGIPALVFQTFIDGALRSIYNDRLGKRWSLFFLFQIIMILLLFVLSNIKLYDAAAPGAKAQWLIPVIALAIVMIVLFSGYFYLVGNFKSTRNIQQQLSEKIATDAIRHFKLDAQKELSKDLEHLGIMARELQAGRTKNNFLEQCERLVEYLLNVPQKNRDTKLIGEILEKAVCLSVTYDGAQFNNENMRKALDILSFSHSHTQNNTVGDTRGSYLNTTIGNCMKEIGIKAMLKDDLGSVMDAIEKLSAIEATSKEMFILGNEALLQGQVQPAVAVIGKLGGDVRRNVEPGSTLDHDDKRAFYFWLGLVSKVYQLGGSAQNFAQRRLHNIIARFGDRGTEIEGLFGETQTHFYQMADFATVDAVKELNEVLFPTP